MQNGGVDSVILNMFMLFHSEIFHVDGTFFDKNGTLVEFPQLCTYDRFVV
jgi:hypothetical protein